MGFGQPQRAGSRHQKRVQFHFGARGRSGLLRINRGVEFHSLNLLIIPTLHK